MSPVKHFSPKNNPPTVPSFSRISIADVSASSQLICLAGQTAVPTSTKPLSAMTFREQVQSALIHVDQLLAAANAAKKDILSNRQYVVGLSKLDAEDRNARVEEIIRWWRETEGDAPPPPATLVGIESLAIPDMLYEIEITCLRSGGTA